MSVFVGVDWGFEHCQVYARREGGQVVLDERIRSTPESIGSVIKRVTADADGSTIHVGIEKATGLVVEQLVKAGLTVYNVNPGKVCRFGWSSLTTRTAAQSAIRSDRRRLSPQCAAA